MTFTRRLSEGQLDPFDLLFKNFFEDDTFFSPLVDKSPKYPVDIYETDEGIFFEIAVVGLDDNDINIEVINNDTLRVSNQKLETTDEKKYVLRNITQKSFSFGWKISKRFDLEKIEASVDKGLLKIQIPCTEKTEENIIKIKPKKK